MAEANLKRCDAICFKISVAVLVFIRFLCAVGRFALKLAMDLAKVFHVTVEELFSYTDD